jgi:hypothetical protein
MTNLLTQADLDALCLTPEEGVRATSGVKEEASHQTAKGLSQADLDALWGALSENGAGQPAPVEGAAAEESSGGLSQADLDALWGLSGLSPGPERMGLTITEEPRPDPIGENLSQDDIDALLAEFGK